MPERASIFGYLSRRIIVLSVIVFLASAVGMAVVTNYFFHRTTEHFRKHYVEQQKELIKRRVEHAITIVRTMRSFCFSKDVEVPVCHQMISRTLAGISFENDNYLFGITDTKKTVFSGGKVIPSVKIHDVIDSDGTKLIDNMIAIARSPSGCGFLSYRWPHPSVYHEDPKGFLRHLVKGIRLFPDSRKISFVKLIPENGWIIGSGVYLSDVNKEFSNVSKELLQHVLVNASVTMIFLFLFLIFAFFVIKHLSHQLEREIGVFSDIIEKPDSFIDLDELRFMETKNVAAVVNEAIAWKNEKETILNRYAAVLEKENEERIRVISRQEEQLRKRNQLLTATNQELKAKMESLDSILSNVSHELKTPLNAIISLSHVLAMFCEQKQALEQKRMARIIERNGTELLKKITGFITLSQDDETVSDSAVKVDRLVEEIIEQDAPLATKQRTSVFFERLTAVPPIFTSEQAVRNILENIIENAIKFTEEGEVRITMQHTVEQLFVTIKDTGVGIPDERIDDIFNKFTRLQPSLSKEYEGTGIGLTIAKRAADKIGAVITVRSTVGEGSVFTVIIPTNSEDNDEKNFSD